jgi:hypothetical protein
VITVYRWDLTGPKTASGFRVGHVSMMVTGGDPAGSAYISWSPERPWPSSKAREHLTLEEDIRLEHGAPIEVLPIGTPNKTLDEGKIKDWWLGVLKSPPRWTLYDTNCAQIVIDAMRVGGSEDYLPKGPWGFYVGKATVWRPWIIPDYVRRVNEGLAAAR